MTCQINYYRALWVGLILAVVNSIIYNLTGINIFEYFKDISYIRTETLILWGEKDHALGKELP